MMYEKETDLRTKVLKYLYSLPFYHDLPRIRKNMLYDEMMKAFAEEEFCEEHSITKMHKATNDPPSSVMYCGEEITFADECGADNFISDMYELSLCCAGKC